MTDGAFFRDECDRTLRNTEALSEAIYILTQELVNLRKNYDHMQRRCGELHAENRDLKAANLELRRFLEEKR